MSLVETRITDRGIGNPIARLDNGEVDAFTDMLRKDTPLLMATRTETIRFLIQVGLREVARKGVRLK
jgi:hypothetical protein